MKINKITKNASAYPSYLREIPDAPKQLYYLGTPPEEILRFPALAVVGSRKTTSYGLQTTHMLTRGVAEQGIVIVSGLALGLDAAAHRAALEAGGATIAVLPCGLDRIYPSSHRQLALQILKAGGTLISEYPEGVEPFKHHFIARNRIIAGLAQAVLIPEAAIKSGSLHTAAFALEQGRTVMAVPGPITNVNCAGTNSLIKNGAALITSVGDILHELGMELTAPKQQMLASSPEEALILDLLKRGVSAAHELQAQSQLDATQFNQTLTLLEISGHIRPLGAGQWALNR